MLFAAFAVTSLLAVAANLWGTGVAIQYVIGSERAVPSWLRFPIFTGISIILLAVGASILSFPTFLLFSAGAIFGPLIMAVDWLTHLIPDRFNLVFALYGWLVLFSLGLLGNLSGVELLHCFLSGVGLSAVLLLSRLISGILSRGRSFGLGLGDVKLAFGLGCIVGVGGVDAIISGFALSFIAAFIYSLVLLGLRKATFQAAIALGPWLMLGFFAVLFS